MVKYTPNYLHKLETLLAEGNYTLRYEKGNFKGGFCILHQTQVVLVNAYYPLDGKVNTLIEIIRQHQNIKHNLSDKSLRLYQEIIAIPDQDLGLK